MSDMTAEMMEGSRLGPNVSTLEPKINQHGTLNTNNVVLDTKEMDKNCSCCRLPFRGRTGRCRQPTSLQMKCHMVT